MHRLLVTVALLLATAFSGPVDAALRAVGPDSQVVLCADGAAVTVTLGADGRPVDPDGHRQHCPDCLPFMLTATGGAVHPELARPEGRRVVARWPAAFPRRAHDPAALPAPRGPPSGNSDV